MSNTHRMRYKNEGVDSKELRRRREEEGIQLRKQKRDIQLFKRRNINDTIQSEDADVSVTRARGRQKPTDVSCGFSDPSLLTLFRWSLIGHVGFDCDEPYFTFIQTARASPK